MKTLTASLALLLVLLGSAPAEADSRNRAEVTLLEGEAFRVPEKGEKSTLEKGSFVFEGDFVETAEGARLQVTLKDGSHIRVGPASKLQLKSAYFGEKGEKNVSARLVFGRVWSKVSGLVGGESKFEVETDNAVAGVRGTTFRVDASRDRSVLVRVYAGAVAMAPGTALPAAAEPENKGSRRRVDAPKEISRAQWEELVGKMMQMSVSADGTPGKPTAFTAEDDAGDAWAAWNRALDGEE